MSIPRPDLSQVPADVLAYIEYLEDELAQQPTAGERKPSVPFEPSEPPTTQQLITITQAGVAKRTARHWYQRQRRAGMGIFDIDCNEADPPKQLLFATAEDTLLVLTSLARAFRLPVQAIPETEIRAKGQNLSDLLPLHAGESIAVCAVDVGAPYLTVLGNKGFVRSLPKHLLGERMTPGMAVYDLREGGIPVAVCRHDLQAHIFVATKLGMAARFPAREIPTFGCPGIRLGTNDTPIGIVATSAKEGVLLVGADGKGSIRLMEGFAANQKPNVSGKIALKTDALIGIAPVDEHSDVFIISRLSKLIRFKTEEIPAKEGVVQGVICMTLRADECVALVTSSAG
jgi:DNA gyrase/topoisomerase IV subunit A